MPYLYEILQIGLENAVLCRVSKRREYVCRSCPASGEGGGAILSSRGDIVGVLWVRDQKRRHSESTK